jgi:hypothetical protein
MASVEYVLRLKSLKSTRPPAPDSDFRLLGFDMTAERKGTPLGGNNIQAVFGAPSEERHRLDEDRGALVAVKLVGNSP